MRLFPKVCWRQRIRRFRRCIGGELGLPEGVMTGGTIGVLKSMCISNEYLMNIVLMSSVVSRMAGQVRHA